VGESELPVRRNMHHNHIFEEKSKEKGEERDGNGCLLD